MTFMEVKKEEVTKTETEEKKEEAKVVPEYFEPIPLLGVVTAAQNQNGLRHKEYQRYQRYCSRKLHK